MAESSAEKKFVCEICSTGYNKESEVRACRKVHYNCSRIIVKLEHSLQDDEKPFADGDIHYKSLLSERQDSEYTNFRKRKLEESIEDNIEGRRVNLWSREATAKLVELLKVHCDATEDKCNLKGKALWQKVYNEFCKVENNLSIYQVRKKWNNLTSHFRRYQQAMKLEIHTKMKKPDFFDDIQEILGPEGLTEVYCDLDPDQVLNFESDTDADANLDKNQTETLKSFRQFEFKTSLEDAVKSIYETEMLDEDEICGPENAELELRKKGNRRRKRPTTRTESVEKSILQLVETNKAALEADQEKTKLLKDQFNQQESFDTEFLRAYKLRNEAIENSTKVVEEFQDMLKLHLKTILEVDIRTKKIEKFLENNL